MAQTSYTSNADAIIEALRKGIESGVSEAVERIAAKARHLCPVGTVEHSGPKFNYERNHGKRSISKYGKWKRNEQGRRLRAKARWGKGWQTRRPGTLRDSIFTRVRWKDSTCLGWVKAGADGTPDGSAFYAPFVEFGTSKMTAKPFMRPAIHGNKAAILNDIADEIGLELGQPVRQGVKRKVYGS